MFFDIHRLLSTVMHFGTVINNLKPVSYDANLSISDNYTIEYCSINKVIHEPMAFFF